MKARRWSSINCAFVLCLAYVIPAAMGQQINAKQKARQILDTSGVRGGLLVHIGCGDGKLTTGLCHNDSFLVHGLDTDSVDIARARAYVRSRNLYGPVSVAKYDGRTLPYRDNLANLVVASSECQVTNEEIARVLAPGGVAVFLNQQSKIGTRRQENSQAPAQRH